MKEEHFFYEQNGNEYPDEEEILTFLASKGVLSFYPTAIIKDGKEIQQTAIGVISSDIFAWGVADCDDLPYDQIGPLFKLYQKNEKWGIIKWLCLQRNEKPQRPIVETMKKESAWDDELDALPENHYDKYCKEDAQKRKLMTIELEDAYKHLTVDRGINTDIWEHMPTIHKYAKECKHLTEMGVREVVSTWALLAARPNKLISCDIIYHPNIEKAKRVAKENYIDFQFIQASTLEVIIEPTELLFIDTLHTYTQLKKELELHAGKVSKYILMHDTSYFAHRGMDNDGRGLMNALSEFLPTSGWKIKEKFDNNNGLTIIERK